MAPKPHHCPHHTLTVHQQPWGAAGLPHGTGTAPLTDLRHKHKKSHRYPGTQRCSLPVTVSSHTTHPQTLQGTQRQAQPPSCPPYQGDPSPIEDSSSAPCTAGADPAARRDPSASHIYSLQVHRAPVASAPPGNAAPCAAAGREWADGGVFREKRGFPCQRL